MALWRNDEIDSDQWERVKQIFDEALACPAAKRTEFLMSVCGDDRTVRAAVEQLLVNFDAAGSFLEEPLLGKIGATLKPADPRLQNGEMLAGRFNIDRFIGKGGMGEVYEATDTELGVRIALKTILSEIASDPKVLNRFKQEVQLARRITHPNVCRIFDIERHTPQGKLGSCPQNEVVFLTMELLKGETLAQLLQRTGRLKSQEALPLLEQIAEGLAAAHSVGVIHRDIKPSNIILVRNREETRAVITDFGLARIAASGRVVHSVINSDSLTDTGAVLGTWAYMAPEQLEGAQASSATDIYAMGLVMYEMVTGCKAFDQSLPIATLARRLKSAPPSPRLLIPELDVRWEKAILRCLQVDQKARFQDARQVFTAVSGSGALDHSIAVGEGITIPNKPAQKFPRHRTAALAVLIFCSILALFGYALRIYQVKRNPTAGAGSMILVTEIKNNTEEARLDTVTELIRRQLSQSGYFNVLDPHRVQDTLTEMTKPSDAHLDSSTAREVALRSGAQRVVFGVLSRVGDEYTLDISIEEPDNDPSRSRGHWENHWFWRAAVTSNRSDNIIPSDFLDTIRASCEWIRHEVGEAANDIARLDAPPQDVTTDNWTALSEFEMAEALNGKQERENAVLALRNAIKSDPHFALAYMRLGDILVSLHRYEEGYGAYHDALREEQERRLTRKEKDRIAGIYAMDTGNYEAADAAFRDYTIYYSNDYLGWFYRAYPLMMLGRVEEANTTLKKAVSIDPARRNAPFHLARFNLILDNFDEAKRWIERLREAGHGDDANYVQGEADFLLGNYSESAKAFASLQQSNDSLYRSWTYSVQACLTAEQGKYREAVQYLEQGLNADIAEGNSANRASKLISRAYLHFRQGRYDTCVSDCRQALQLDRSLQNSMAVGTLLGRVAFETKGTCRNRAVAELLSVEAELPKGHFPPISDIVHARVRGEILLARGSAKSALAKFEVASHLEAFANDREYLARGLLAAAKEEKDPQTAQREREEALTAYERIALRPGQVWQLPQDYYPGYLSDQVFSYLKLASSLGRFDARAERELRRYLIRRQFGDTSASEFGRAKQLGESHESQIH
jgi:eukaryotic-like serine/threonine-protein kinase